MHLYVGRAYIDFITGALNAMIMCLLAVVAASLISVRTVVAWRVSHETVLQALVPLFVPFEVSDHFFFLDEHS